MTEVMLRDRNYIVESEYYRRGMAISLKYEVDGKEIGQHLRDGTGKLSRNGNRVFLMVKGRKGMVRVSAELVKGIRPEFWEKPEMARKGNPYY